jgi:TolA-binding protein
MIRFLRLGKRRAADRCPDDWMLTRHVSGEGAEPWLETHLRQCVRCAGECEALSRLVTHARRLDPPAPMTAAARRAISARLLTTGAEAPAPRAPRWRFIGAAAAAIVIAAVALGARGRGRTPLQASAAAPPPLVAHQDAPAADRHDGDDRHLRSRATIRAIGAARFTREQAPPDDVVRLESGAIVLEVAHLIAGERFRVRTDDAEVEVHGTRFQVSAVAGQLTAVSVASGRVEVRSPGGGHVFLEPGDEWVRGADQPAAAFGAASGQSVPAKVASAAPAPVPARASRARAAPATVGSSQPRGAAAPRSASFDRAWSLLRRGDARQAATLFAEVERSAGDRDIAEDALYWCAVATRKAGDRAEAQALFERFLRRFPISARAGEAAAALGWLYVESGRPVDARRAFERAADDPSPAVRASAHDGLQRTGPPH